MQALRHHDLDHALAANGILVNHEADGRARRFAYHLDFSTPPENFQRSAMPSGNKHIKTTLKNVLVPQLTAERFEGKFAHFMRREDDTLHLLTVQFDRWSGGFFLEFASHPAGDKSTSWGEIVPEADLTAAHADAESRARLQGIGSSNSTSEMWFRFEGFNRTECESLVMHVVEIFPQVNAWLRESEVGKKLFHRALRSACSGCSGVLHT